MILPSSSQKPHKHSLEHVGVKKQIKEKSDFEFLCYT